MIHADVWLCVDAVDINRKFLDSLLEVLLNLHVATSRESTYDQFDIGVIE